MILSIVLSSENNDYSIGGADFVCIIADLILNQRYLRLLMSNLVVYAVWTLLQMLLCQPLTFDTRVNASYLRSNMSCEIGFISIDLTALIRYIQIVYIAK